MGKPIVTTGSVKEGTPMRLLDLIRMGQSCEAAGLVQMGELYGKRQPLMSPSREIIENAAFERAARTAEEGSFLHDEAPTARFGREVAAAIRRLKHRT